MPSAAARSLSTRGYSRDEQLQVWQQIVNDTFLPVSIECASDADGFSSELRARAVGDLGVSWIGSDRQVVRRTDQLVRRAPGDLYFLNLPLHGHGLASQDGRSGITHAGDFVLIDANRPFTLEFDEPFEQVSLAIPHAVLDPMLARPELTSCLVVDGHAGVGAVAAAAVRALASQPGRLNARESRIVTEHVVALVAVAVSELALNTCPTGRERHLQAALDEIDRSLADPALSPGLVATRISISVSYLTKLFAQQGSSFGKVLLRRRLDRAYALLAPGQAPGPGITAVAIECGMPDPAYFSHAFRGRFGMSPTQRRDGR